jgi:hypothetical protein
MPENLTHILRIELAQIEQRARELDQRKQAILNLLRTYEGLRTGSGVGKGKLLPMPDHRSLSTLDMAQRVIEKHGEMKAEEIMEEIRQEFGVKPAHTLPQMLYIRARSKKRFYRSSTGKFGVVETAKKKPPKRSAA